MATSDMAPGKAGCAIQAESHSTPELEEQSLNIPANLSGDPSIQTNMGVQSPAAEGECNTNPLTLDPSTTMPANGNLDGSVAAPENAGMEVKVDPILAVEIQSVDVPANSADAAEIAANPPTHPSMTTPANGNLNGPIVSLATAGMEVDVDPIPAVEIQSPDSANSVDDTEISVASAAPHPRKMDGPVVPRSNGRSGDFLRDTSPLTSLTDSETDHGSQSRAEALKPVSKARSTKSETPAPSGTRKSSRLLRKK